MIDSNASREFIYQLTGTIDLGAMAVHGFFLFSGYLIYQSYQNSSSNFTWFMRRVLRIYPAFVVVWLVSIFIAVPMTGATHLLFENTNTQWVKMMIKVLFLSVPDIEGHHEETGIETINGSLWTIRYEFLCYLLIPLIALFGLKSKNILIALAISISVFLFTHTYGDLETDIPFNVSAALLSRLSAAFLIGICFFKYKERIIWNHWISILCVILLIISLNSNAFALLGFNIFGGYLLFNFAFNFKNSFIQNINNRYDISYGVYIYAWPIQILIILNNPTINPWLLSAITIIVASILGYLSWRYVEKPFLGLKKHIPPNLKLDSVRKNKPSNRAT